MSCGREASLGNLLSARISSDNEILTKAGAIRGLLNIKQYKLHHTAGISAAEVEFILNELCMN